MSEIKGSFFAGAPLLLPKLPWRAGRPFFPVRLALTLAFCGPGKTKTAFWQFKNLMEEYVKTFTVYLAGGAEIGAAFIIGFASLKALGYYLLGIFRPGGQIFPKNDIRLSLGRSLALALEFLLGADILKTAVAPTWNEIGQLAAIAILRTGLNYFLERELKAADKHPETHLKL